MFAPRVFVAIALLALGGCSSDPPPRQQPAPAAPDPVPEKKPPPPEAKLPEELTDGLLDLFLSSDALEDDPNNWVDDTYGATVTLTYVTARRVDQTGATQPVAIVVSSDETHGQFRRRSTARVTVRRLKRQGMGALMQDLDRRGLEGLSWVEEPYDAVVGPERALVLYREGKRYRCEKDRLQPAQQADFTAIERRLIELLMPR